MMQREVIDLDEVELDGEAAPAQVLALVDALRLRAKTHALVVRNCPQMLAHTLYKAGLLRDGAIVLESVRDEEPYG